MALSDFRSAYLPYCLQRMPDGRYVVLNREYKPLGFRTTVWVKYEEYPISSKLKRFTARTAATLSYNKKPDVERIYLYNDGCVPTHSEKHMSAYLKRLAMLAKLNLE